MTEILLPRQIQRCQEVFSDQTLRLQTIDLEQLSEKLLGVENEFAKNHLSPSEQKRFFSFTYRKRQVEWLGGRIAAKKAVTSLLSAKNQIKTKMTDFSIDSTPEGRPLLHSHLVRFPVDISISHSNNRATAMAVANSLCGIDIQEITKTISKVKSRFITTTEEQIIRQVPCLAAYDEETPLALVWSAKEAFRKGFACKPVLGFSELTLTQVSGTIEHGLIGVFQSSRPEVDSPIKAFFTLSVPFAIAITCNTSPYIRHHQVQYTNSDVAHIGSKKI